MRRRGVSATALILAGALLLGGCDGPTRLEVPPQEDVTFRVALFNIWELSTAKIQELDAHGVGQNEQLRAAAEIIRIVRPDVLVLNEVDHDYEAGGYPLTDAARAFARHYLETGADPLEYPYAYAEPNNTGMLSGVDLNGDGKVATEADTGSREHGDDSYGFGTYPGQYSMAVLSMYPVISGESRTFQNFLWRDQPGNHLPTDFYSEEAIEILRLSSKSHQDVPVAVDGRRVHLFLSHPTPPVFDGDEDRNGRRNFDEIMFWRQYIDGEAALVDDAGEAGGYAAGQPFVLIGDLNAPAIAAPGAEDVVYDGVRAIEQLLQHTAIQDPAEWQVSPGAPAGNPQATTAFGGSGRRIDYVLPSRGVEILDGGVYWPDAVADPEGNARALLASDHRLVWLDVRIPGE